MARPATKSKNPDFQGQLCLGWFLLFCLSFHGLSESFSLFTSICPRVWLGTRGFNREIESLISVALLVNMRTRKGRSGNVKNQLCEREIYYIYRERDRDTEREREKNRNRNRNRERESKKDRERETDIKYIYIYML